MALHELGAETFDLKVREAYRLAREGDSSLIQRLAERAYELGYSDGESNVAADWDFALTEHLGLGDAMPTTPMAFVTWLLDNYDLEPRG